MDRKLLLEDTFKYKTVPFLVRVEEKKMYVNGKRVEVRGVNINGHPTGMRRTPRGWTMCDMVVARVRPDYPYSIDKPWPENVDKHFKAYEPLEWPVKKRGIIFRRYVAEPREQNRDAQELAQAAIDKLKDAYENRDKVESLK